MKRCKQKGFTLVELIIVIAILAILVGVLAPQYIRYVDRARYSRDTQLADRVRSAVLVAAVDPTAGLEKLPTTIMFPVRNMESSSIGVEYRPLTQLIISILAITDVPNFDKQLQHKESKMTWIEIKNRTTVKVYITNEENQPDRTNSNCSIIVG